MLHARPPDRDIDEISIDGTIKFCEDLSVNPEDVALLAVAYELKSPGVGAFPKEGWVDGWKRLQCDSIPKIKAQLAQLNSKLANDTEYLQAVYNYTFNFAKSEGQRSIREFSTGHLTQTSGSTGEHRN